MKSNNTLVEYNKVDEKGNLILSNAFTNLPPMNKSLLDDLDILESDLTNWMKEQKELPNNADDIIDLYLKK